MKVQLKPVPFKTPTQTSQNYIINSAKVMFLNHRPHSKIGRVNGADTCRTCHRHLREGFSYCSLACKVEALHLTCGGAAISSGAAGSASASAGGDAAAAQPPPAAAAVGPGAVSLIRAGSDITGSAAAAVAAAVARQQPVSPATATAAAAASGVSPFALEPAVAAAAGGAVAAAASCAALSSDPESSEPGELRVGRGWGLVRTSLMSSMQIPGDCQCDWCVLGPGGPGSGPTLALLDSSRLVVVDM